MSALGAPDPRTPMGRPVSTSHAAIEQVAFQLFAERGFEGTTLEAIANEVGVGRRTLFRYFSSKNDIPWGQFDASLEEFREVLQSMPADLPLWEAVHRGVLRFNQFGGDIAPSHRERMVLILRTPALQAHSVLRYAQWREVVAEFVAARRGLQPTDLLPQVVGQVSLALTLSAYTIWLSGAEQDLDRLLGDAMLELRGYLEV